MSSGLVQEYLDEAVLRTPEKTAVSDGKSSLSYSQLGSFSSRLSFYLSEQGVRRQEKVIIWMERSVNYIAAILGVLKVDAVYVPIDAKAPFERFIKIVNDVQPKACLCDEVTDIRLREYLTLASIEIKTVKIIYETTYETQIEKLKLKTLPDGYISRYENNETDAAYILYTSGTTGIPKGVIITHLNIRKYIDWAVKCFDIKENDKLLGTAPFHFDMSTFDIYCSLKSSATFCIAHDNMMLFPDKLMKFMEEEKVTVWKGISSLLAYMARANVLSGQRLRDLKTILFAGETLPTKYLIHWMKIYPEKIFYNAYGPTEATGVSLYYRIYEAPASSNERIPIGVPRDETEVFIIDEEMSSLSEGQIGEICIGGPCLSSGYLNDPVKTSQNFIENPIRKCVNERVYRTGDLGIMRDDGNFELIGRKDRQVKFMGYRIELGEIEHALLSIENINDAAVVMKKSQLNNDSDELTAFYESNEEMDIKKITEIMKNKLPTYMLPRKYIRLERIPRNNRGKIDNEALILM